MYMKLRNWGWWKLFAKMRPMLKHTDMEDEMRKRDEEIKEKERKLKELEEKAAKEKQERQSMMMDFERLQQALRDKEAENEAKAAEVCNCASLR